jgi:hypothetical protein
MTSGAPALSRLLSGVLYGISATHPMTLAAISALLVLVALGACACPSRAPGTAPRPPFRLAYRAHRQRPPSTAHRPGSPAR